MASRPDRQTLFTVVAGVVIGMPALTAAWRDVICPAPACRTWPMITYSTWCAGSAIDRAERRLDGEAAEVGGGEARERTEQAADRRTRSANDHWVAP